MWHFFPFIQIKDLIKKILSAFVYAVIIDKELFLSVMFVIRAHVYLGEELNPL